VKNTSQGHLNFLFGDNGKLPVIIQTEATECGLACLAMISEYHGQEISLLTLRQRFHPGQRGITLQGLVQIAEQINLKSRAVRI
jgi:ATP-binding cassette subfamily B protein RaxB